MGTDHRRVLVESRRPDGLSERHDDDEPEGVAIRGPQQGEWAKRLEEGPADEGGVGGGARAQQQEGGWEGEEDGDDGLDGYKELEGRVRTECAHKVLGEGRVEMAEGRTRAESDDERDDRDGHARVQDRDPRKERGG